MWTLISARGSYCLAIGFTAFRLDYSQLPTWSSSTTSPQPSDLIPYHLSPWALILAPLAICLFPGPYRGGSCPRAFACARPSAVTFLLWMSTWLTLSFLHESRRRKPSLTMAPSRCVPLTPFPLSSGPFSPADTLPFCLFFNHLLPATGCQLYEDRDFVVLGIAPPVPRIVPGM